MVDVTQADGDAPEQQTEQKAPGFGERGRMRRRARFLRKARELAYRDLGGLVFDLHRFGQRNDQVVSAKLAALAQMDVELRALEKALDQHQSVTVLREVGIAACPRCAAIHGREDRFCPGCGLPFDANAERPLATAPTSAAHHPAPSSNAPSEPPAPTPSAPAAPGAPSANPEPAVNAAPPGNAAPGAPAVKPTAQPVAAPPATQPQKEDEQETQILRPPAPGAPR